MRRKHPDYLPTTIKVWTKAMTKKYKDYADERKSRYQGEVSMTLLNVVDNVNDPVNHPNHYTSHPSGVEVIQITEHMNFCLGNAIKYILRAEHKGKQIEDLKKAVWYINREIERLENG